MTNETVQELMAQSWLPGRVTPEYGGRCISNLPGAIVRLFGGAAPRTLPFPLWNEGRPPRQVALLVLDALGWDVFVGACDLVPTLRRVAEQGQTRVLTSVFPSTTNVALTTLYTGLTPREHGIVGHVLFLREVGMSVDLLRFSLGGDVGHEILEARGLKPREFAPVTTLFEQLAALGVRGMALTRQSIEGTSLAQIHHAGADVVTYLTSSDLMVHLRRLMELDDGPRFVFAYWDLIDTLSHFYRPDSPEVLAEIAALFHLLEREVLDALPSARRSETLLLLVADHGQLPVSPEEAVTVADHPCLEQMLMLPPNGGPRYAYLHPLPGREAGVREYLAALPEQFLTLDTAEAMERGLWGMGEMHPEALYRTGPLLALAQGRTRFYRAHVPPRLVAMRGIHGGLSPEEMLVPFITLPLEAW